MTLLIILIALLFAGLAFFRFHIALALFLFLLPSYLIRFSIGPLPSTMLELMVGIIVLVWLVREGPRVSYHLMRLVQENRQLTLGVLLFITGATLSLFPAVDIQAALGAWKAFYIEPILFFFVLITSIKSKRDVRFLLTGLVLSGFVTSLLAIYQHYTGWMVPYDFWEKGNSFRVTGWYGFPNGVGLFVAPLIPLAIYLAKEVLSIQQDRRLDLGEWSVVAISILFVATAPLALVFAKSTGALVGVAAGIGFLLFWNKSTRKATGILGILGLLSILLIPQLQPIQDELLLQDRSGQIRLSIWGETWALIQDNPIAGAGLASYSEKIEPYHTTVNGEGIEIFHHPHNIFLTIWVNIGLVGLAGFILILVWFFRTAQYHPLLIAAAMVILLVHGLVDSPYIKNDLSILFWTLPALLFLVETTHNQMEIR